jgi:RHS repeat-associated protein
MKMSKGMGYRVMVVLLLALGLGRAWSGTVYLEYTDPQGTVLAEADVQGHIVARYDYRPYGGVVSGSGPNGPGYTGHVQDPETGLVYMQARYYQARGQFLSPDPVGPSPGNIFSFNRYAYGNNNPIGNIDPDGREAGFVYHSDGGMTNFWSGSQNDAAIAKANDQLATVLQAVDEFSQAFPDGAVEHAAIGPIIAGLSASKVEIKAARLAENAAKGVAAEAKVGGELGAKVAGKRVTLEASTGQRSVADFVTKDKSVVEVKSGGARLSTGQKAVKADVEAGREVIPRGQNAERAGLTPGQPTPMKCYDVTRC